MSHWVFFTIVFAGISLFNGIMTSTSAYLRRVAPGDLTLAQMTIVNGNARFKDKFFVFLIQFIGSFVKIWVVVFSLIIALLYKWIT